MKRLFIVVLLLLFSFSLFAYVDTSGMTQEQLRMYNRQMLSVSERVVTTSSAYGGAWKTSPSTAMAYASGSSSSSLTWDAYQGPNLIAKADFFKLAGEIELYKEYNLAAMRTAEKRKQGVGFATVGGIGATLGAIMMFAGIDPYVSRDEMGLMVGGAIIFGISCIPLYIGVFDLKYTEEPNVSASFAMGVADIYNQKLAAEIRLKY